jgi:ubiquinone/menaquinone biosynthesis C-methylase UbiE
MSSVDYHLQELTATSLRDRYPDVSRARRILDVGCGVGQTILRLGGDFTRYFGIDVDAEAVRYGVVNYGLSLCVARGENLPFRDASFDFVYCRVSIPYMGISSSLKEFHRVLEVGGEVWLSLHPFAFWCGEFLNVRTPKALIYHARIESFQTEQSMRRALVSVGFGNIKMVNAGEQFVVSARR